MKPRHKCGYLGSSSTRLFDTPEEAQLDIDKWQLQQDLERIDIVSRMRKEPIESYFKFGPEQITSYLGKLRYLDSGDLSDNHYHVEIVLKEVFMYFLDKNPDLFLEYARRTVELDKLQKKLNRPLSYSEKVINRIKNILK